MPKVDYTDAKAKEDAETILTRIMKRRNFGAQVRDELAEFLERVVRRETT